MSPSGMRTISRPLFAVSPPKAVGVTAWGRSRSPRPSAIKVRVALGESWMPAPVSSSRSACSSTTARNPFHASASAVVSPAIPAPAMMTMRGDGRGRAPERRSSRRGQHAFGRPRGAGLQRRIVTIERRAIGTDVFGFVAHVAIHMGMVERRLGADAHELFGADFDHRNAEVVVEVGNDIVRHDGSATVKAGGTIAV